jgi:hypothetical protein
MGGQLTEFCTSYGVHRLYVGRKNEQSDETVGKRVKRLKELQALIDDIR